MRSRAVSTCVAALVLGFGASPALALPECSTLNPPKPITDLDTITDAIVIANPTGTITDLNVVLDIAHTFVGDLEITLNHTGANATVRLFNRQCGFEDDIEATFDDEGSPTTCSNIPPPAVAGSVQGAPVESSPPDPTLLTAFDGFDGMGTWTLSVEDHANADQGTLNEWCLDLTVVLDSDNDGVPDGDDTCPGSETSTPLMIDSCDTGVENYVDTGGCTIADWVGQCAADARNHGKFVSCVAHLTNDLKGAGTISGREKGAIQRCAAQADLP